MKGVEFSHKNYFFLFPDACTQFLIDLGLELVILYEHVYEIYGDIQGATTSFKIKAYEQG